MNGRHPTIIEQRYIRICCWDLGCIPCRIDGRHQQDPNETWITFHHDPDFGSLKPECHLHGYSICVSHHQGINNVAGLPVRHPGGSSANAFGQRYQDRYGRDNEICHFTWRLIERLRGVMPLKIGDLMAHCPFEDLREVA